MADRIWSQKDLERFLRYEDPEVRFWAADRLSRHYSDGAAATLAPYLFDEHEVTPELVAACLGENGGPEHVPHLTRAVANLRGMPAARALEALIRLGAPEALDLVRTAASRRDFDEEAWTAILEALSEQGEAGARAAFQDVLRRRADWVGLPAVLGSALRRIHAGEYRPLLQAWLRSLQWRGAGAGSGGGNAGESFRVLMDHLQIDDCGWCFRTTLAGRIDFNKTVKAVESSYDCDLRPTLDDAARQRIATALEAGAYEKTSESLAAAVRHLARGAVRVPGDDLVGRIEEATGFWGDAEVSQAVEGLGPHLREWVIGFLLSAVFKMARYRNYELDVRRGQEDLDALLPLLETETSAMVEALPHALLHAVEAAGPAGGTERSAARRKVEERCLALLAMRGPFFPQVMARETLGALRSVGAVNEIIDYLDDDNSYVYEAAEHAMSALGEAITAPARARLEAENLSDDAAHSLLIALCEIGTPEALRLVLDHFDTFVDAAGAADAARFMSLLGARELIDPLRGILHQDKAQVGQAILLLAGIHNIHVPEDAAIKRAIDEYWKEQPEGGDSGDPGPDDGSGKYVM